MDAKIATLEVKVESLESWAEKHEREDDRTHKYMNHMAEDILAKMAGLERSAARFESDLAHRNGQQVDTQASLKEIFDRIRKIERLIWIAVGGLGAVTAVATFFGWNILKLLAK